MKILPVALAMVAWPCLSWAQLNDAVTHREMVGVKEVQVFVLSDDDDVKCGIPRNHAIKSAIENKLAAAGIVISEPNKQQIVVWISSSDGGDKCAINIIFEFRKILDFISGTRRENGPITIWNARLLTTRAKQRPSFEANFFADPLDLFLSRWRTANIGADFVRPVAVNQQQAGPNIRTVQQRLVTLGHLQGTVDGISGPATREAIQAFQRSNRMPATGDLDQETMLKLFP
jgi:hypothetical protein